MEFTPGDRVVFRGTGEPECGIIICTWTDQHGDQHCYIAFFGDKFPEGEPEEKPYVLRYYAGSLERAPE